MPISTLTPQQRKLRRKLKEDMAKILNRRPVFAQDRYAHMVANAGDWIIAEQAPRRLPLSLRQSLLLELRDLGESLLEETRTLNNRYVGLGFRTAEVMLTGDPEFLELHARTLAWGGEVAAQVNFKLRHQARDDPYRAFFNAYDSIVTPIEQNIVHGKECLHSLVWESVVDLLPYQLFDATLLKPRHLTLSHDATPAHRPELTVTRDVSSPRDRDRLQSILSLYAVEPVAYMDGVVLTPLLAALRDDPTLPGPEQRHRAYQSMLADLLEAYPYLLSSDRAERYMFTIPGTTCVAAFSFLASNGCAKIVVSDDVESLRRGMHTNFVRGALNVGYDGRVSWWMHPWRTLDRFFGEEAAMTLSWWLLEQVHGRLVQDYLAIQRYHLDRTEARPAEPESGDITDETLLYVSLARVAEDERRMEDTAPIETPGTPDAEVGRGATMLPQLRRRYFFKLLEHCGVEIAQGKGSEIKLLRKAKRPFRLGDHHGSNPTIPAFLAANILKRLEITSDEWIEAIAAH